MINVTVISGRLTKDPEQRVTRSSKAVTTMTVAHDHGGDRGASFFFVETWERLAETCSQHLVKGQAVTVQGYLKQESWEDQEGRRQSRMKVVAHRVDFGAKPRGANDGATTAYSGGPPTEVLPPEPTDDDIPF